MVRETRTVMEDGTWGHVPWQTRTMAQKKSPHMAAGRFLYMEKRYWFFKLDIGPL